jgi:hypothetical protein
LVSVVLLARFVECAHLSLPAAHIDKPAVTALKNRAAVAPVAGDGGGSDGFKESQRRRKMEAENKLQCGSEHRLKREVGEPGKG